MASKFQAKITSRDYPIYKNVIWNNAEAVDIVTAKLEADKKSIKIDP